LTYFGRLAVAIGLVTVALFAAGCGETIIDQTKVEDQIKATAEESPDTKVSSVDCPSDVQVEAKATFTCTVQLVGGGTETATLLIRDEDANLTLLNLQPDK
jgi:hypothetical protein